MSTTKDKSQGPYRVKERLEFGITSIYVDGPNGFVYTTGAAVPEGLRSAIINDMCRQLNAAYQAGQAERDELVKVVRLFLKEFNDVLENTPIAYYKVERAATDLLTRITNP